MVRAMRAMDAVANALLRRASGRELTASTWPKAPPENYRPSVLRLLAGLARSYTGDRRMGVVVVDGRPLGMVIARSRATGIVWDIDHLVATEAGPAVDLLGWACDHAVAAGGRRVFLETPPEDLGAEVAQRAGFERFSEGTTFRWGAPADGQAVPMRDRLDAGFTRDVAKEDTLPARPRLSSDEQGLFQLYNAAVPAQVRAAEAMTYDEWRALHRGRRAWSPSVLSSQDDFVWELGGRIIGWMRLTFGDRSQFLELLIHPLYESYADKMLRCALEQASPKVPVLLDVREYHAGSRAALERVGFHPGATYTIWVRQLAVRIPEPVGSVTAHAQAPA